MTTRYQRHCRIETGAELGIVAGILATDGEASDGHILSMQGAQAEPGAPLLFGHDAFSGTANLGSWTRFRPSEHELRGEAQIEMAGIGAQADWRADLAHMIAQGHVSALSVRWEPLKPPVRRINLASDHPAYVDAEKAHGDDPRRWGYYFDAWRVLEGSVVTIGADPAALIGRIAQARGADRDLWRGALADYFAQGAAAPELREAYTALAGSVEALRGQGVTDFGTLLRLCGMGTDASSLVSVEYGDGQRVLIPREAHDRLVGSARERLELAFDLLADGMPLLVEPVREPAPRGVPEVPHTAPASVPAQPVDDLLERVRVRTAQIVRDSLAAR